MIVDVISVLANTNMSTVMNSNKNRIRYDKLLFTRTQKLTEASLTYCMEPKLKTEKNKEEELKTKRIS